MDQAGSAAEDASQRRHDGDAVGLRHYVHAQSSMKLRAWSWASSTGSFGTVMARASLMGGVPEDQIRSDMIRPVRGGTAADGR